MESAPDGNGLNGWLIGAVVALIGIIWNGLREKLKSHENRINNHAQRLTALDSKTEDGE